MQKSHLLVLELVGILNKKSFDMVINDTYGFVGDELAPEMLEVRFAGRSPLTCASALVDVVHLLQHRPWLLF